MESQKPRPNIRSFIILWALASSGLSAQNGKFTASVVGISDGDTIQVFHDGASLRVRLWGIDCPEARQPFGTKAKRFTGDLAFGKDVTLLVRDIDRYGRRVAEVFLPDGRNLNHEIVKAGFGWWFVRYARHDKELQRFEAEARQARRGLWADEKPTPPWVFRNAVPMPLEGAKGLP